MDGVVYSKYWWAILYGQTKIVVEGTPLMDPSLTSNEKMPEYSIAKLDKVGKIHEFKEISKDEYLNIKNGIVQELTPQNFKSTSEL